MPELNPEILIVPMSVEALVQSAADAAAAASEFAGARADFSRLPYRDANGAHWKTSRVQSGDTIRTALFPAEEPPGRGVHLHWALPDALTRADSASGRLRFPTAPDRWLVVRFAFSAANIAEPPRVRGWVVESDYLMDEAAYQAYVRETNRTSVTMPARPTAEAPEPFRYIGRVFDLAGWREGGNAAAARQTDLSAIGYGEELFAAYYPESRSVFGFYDALDDVAENARLVYSVTGWYSNAERSPFYNRTGDATLQALRWRVSAGAGPTSALFSGSAYNIAWDPAAGRSALPAPAEVRVAVGSNLSEALSAVLAERMALATGDATRAPHYEYLLDALQSGQLADAGVEPGALHRLMYALHKSAFTPEDGGTIWLLSQADAATARSDRDETALLQASESLAAELPADVADLLHELNVLQSNYDEAQRRIRSLRETVHADWLRYQTLNYPETAAPDAAAANAAYRFMRRELDLLDDLRQGCGELVFDERGLATLGAGSGSDCAAARVLAALRALQTRLASAPAGPYSVAAAPASRFYRPADPAVLLAGADLAPPARYSDAGVVDAGGALYCRRASEIPARIFYASAGAQRTPLAYDFAGALAIEHPAAPELRALAHEALLYDPAAASFFAASNQIPGAVDAIQSLQRDVLQAAPGAHAALDPQARPPVALGVSSYRARHMPLFLHWEARYSPFDDVSLDYPEEYIKARFALDDDRVDMTYNREPADAAEFLSGVALLAPGAAVKMHRELEALLAGLQNADLDASALLGAAADELRVMPLLSQTLHGFHDALLMKRSALELQVDDPLAPDPLGQALALRARNAPGRTPAFAPVPASPFHPVRAGVFRITRLRVIDIFGRVRTIEAPPLICSHSMAPRSGGVADFAYLRPRITQAARLRARWLSAGRRPGAADAAAQNHPGAGPVLGWLTLDRSGARALLHAANGAPLGALTLSGDEQSVLLEGGPGEGRTPDPTLWPEPRLAALTTALLLPGRAPMFAALLDAIDRTLLSVEAGNGLARGLAMLLGRPLALVRIELALELNGSPALHQGWEAFQHALANGDPEAPRDCRAFPRVHFPVRLGDTAFCDDGLIGYFLEGAAGADYSRFYCTGGASANANVAPPAPDQIVLAADGSRRVVTALIDPSAKVHAISSILPVETLQLAPAHYESALRSLQAWFSAFPLLGEPDRQFAPTPPLAGFAWNYVSPPGLTSVALSGAPAPAPGRVVARDGWLQLTKRNS